MADQDDSVSLIRLQVVEDPQNKAILARYRADLASLNAASSVNQVNTQLNAQAASVQKVGAAWDDVAASRLNAETQSSSPSYQLDEQTGKIKSIADSWQEAADAKLNYSAIPVDSGGGGSGDTGGGSGSGIPFRALSSLARVVPGGTEAGRLFRGAGALETLGVDLGTLGSAALVASPAIILAAVAVKGFKDEMDAIEKSLTAALNAQDAYYDALANSTTENVKAQITALKSGQAAIQQQINENQGVIDSNNAKIAQAGSGLEEIANAIANSKLSDKIGELKQKFDTNADSITRLTQGLDSNTFAANDAADAEKKLVQTRIATADVVKQLVIDEATFATASADSLKSTLDRLRIDQQGNSAGVAGLLGDDSQDAIDKRKAYSDAVKDDQTRIEAITGTYLPLAEQRDKEIKQLEDQAAVIQDSIKYQAQLTELTRTATVTQVTDRLASIQAEHDATLKFIPELEANLADATAKLGANSDTARKAALALADAQTAVGAAEDDYADTLQTVVPAALSRAAATLQADLNKIESTAATKIASINQDEADKELAIRVATDGKLDDLAKKHGVDAARAQQDLNDAIQDLRDKANEDERTAVGRRDAVSYTDAQRQEAKAEAQDKKNATKAETRRDEDYKTALDQLAQSNEDQLKAARAAAAKQVQQTKDAEAEQARVKQQAYNDQLAALNQFTSTSTSLLSQFGSVAAAVFQDLVNKANSAANTVSSSPSSNSSPIAAAVAAAFHPNTSGQSPVAQAVAQYAAYKASTFDPGGSVLHALGYASGGHPTPGSWFVAGENGPELIRISRPSTVYNNQQTRGMGGAGTGASLTVNLNGVTMKTVEGQTMAQIEREIHGMLVEMGV